MNRSSRNFTMVSVMVLCFVLSGCGDDDNPVSTSGGGGETQADMLKGSFLAVGVYSDAWSHFTTMNWSGDGVGSYDRILDSDGDTEEGGSYPYTLLSDGRINVGTSERMIRGMCDRSGNVFAINLPKVGENASLDVGVRVGQRMDNGDFNGLYRGVGLEMKKNGPSESLVFTLNANGRGSLDYNLEMTSTGRPDNGTMSYQIASNGAFSTADDPNLRGILGSDGSILAFSELDAADAALHILFKVGSGLNNGDLQGEYVFLQMETDGDSCYGEVTLNGNGGYVASDLYSTSPLEVENGTYQVMSDGRVTIDAQMYGCMSPDGEMAVLISMGSSQDLVFMIKKH